MAIDDQGLVHTDEEDEEEYVEDGEYEDDEELDDEGDTADTQQVPGLRHACECSIACRLKLMIIPLVPLTTLLRRLPLGMASDSRPTQQHIARLRLLSGSLLPTPACHPAKRHRSGAGAACRRGRRGGAGCGAR